MEQLFLNNNFHYVEVITVSNGVSWTVEALCQQIVTFYKARDSNADAFVVWVDRENRSESATEVEKVIRNSLSNAGAAEEKIHILVADKMTENIILADETFVRAKFGNGDYVYEHEGSGGKHKLKEMFKAIGVNYRETLHGVQSLKAIRLGNCRSKSASVDAFLSTFQHQCWWTQSN